jgi:hypothetical protein
MILNRSLKFFDIKNLFFIEVEGGFINMGAINGFMGFQGLIASINIDSKLFSDMKTDIPFSFNLHELVKIIQDRIYFAFTDYELEMKSRVNEWCEFVKNCNSGEEMMLKLQIMGENIV